MKRLLRRNLCFVTVLAFLLSISLCGNFAVIASADYTAEIALESLSSDTSGTGWAYVASTNTLTLNTSGEYRVYGTGTETANTITVANSVTGVTLTIDNLYIQGGTDYKSAIELGSGSSVTLVPVGENKLYGYCPETLITTGTYDNHGGAGIMTSNATLTIDGSGSIEASAGYGAAAIGGINKDGFDSNGTLEIVSGTVIAIGRRSLGEPSTIGGVSPSGSAGTINITGGTVLVYSTGTVSGEESTNVGRGRSIGSGSSSADGTINISGGLVIASGMGIGSTPWNFDQTNQVTVSGSAVVIANCVNGPATGNAVIITQKTYSKNSPLTAVTDDWASGGATLNSRNIRVTIEKDTTIPTGTTLELPPNVSLTIPSGMTLTNNGKIINQSGNTISNNGTIVNAGTITNAGTIDGGGVLLRR